MLVLICKLNDERLAFFSERGRKSRKSRLLMKNFIRLIDELCSALSVFIFHIEACLAEIAHAKARVLRLRRPEV
jgi:uncharacterized protein with ParB-like and HNH nuclease domain